MTNNHSSHRSSLFLLELILAILFFSIASAVCVQLFVKSHLLSKDAQNLSFAVGECSNVAEIIYSADTKDDVLKRLKNAYPDASYLDHTFTVFYETGHTMNTTCDFSSAQEDCPMMQANISFVCNSNQETIYQLNITHQLKETGYE